MSTPKYLKAALAAWPARGRRKETTELKTIASQNNRARALDIIQLLLLLQGGGNNNKINIKTLLRKEQKELWKRSIWWSVSNHVANEKLQQYIRY